MDVKRRTHVMYFMQGYEFLPCFRVMEYHVTLCKCTTFRVLTGQPDRCSILVYGGKCESFRMRPVNQCIFILEWFLPAVKNIGKLFEDSKIFRIIEQCFIDVFKSVVTDVIVSIFMTIEDCLRRLEFAVYIRI